MPRLMDEHGLLRCALVGLVLSAATGIASAEAAKPPQLRLSAFAVDTSGIGHVRTERIEIVIDRWSTDAEHDSLLDVLKNKGSDKLLGALQALTPAAGYIRTTTSLGWHIQYAREHPLPDGGRRIVFATDRPMSFFELQNQTHSSEYEFMWCEIHLGRDNTGAGKLAALAKISYDKEKRQIAIENYGIEPERLTRVSTEK